MNCLILTYEYNTFCILLALSRWRDKKIGDFVELSMLILVQSWIRMLPVLMLAKMRPLLYVFRC